MRQIVDLIAQAEAVEIGIPPSVVRDPKDDIFVATALAAGADYIVSEDKDLLDLGTTSSIPIVDTQTFIALFESKR